MLSRYLSYLCTYIYWSNNIDDSMYTLNHAQWWIVNLNNSLQYPVTKVVYLTFLIASMLHRIGTLNLKIKVKKKKKNKKKRDRFALPFGKTSQIISVATASIMTRCVDYPENEVIHQRKFKGFKDRSVRVYFFKRTIQYQSV